MLKYQGIYGQSLQFFVIKISKDLKEKKETYLLTNYSIFIGDSYFKKGVALFTRLCGRREFVVLDILHCLAKHSTTMCLM